MSVDAIANTIEVYIRSGNTIENAYKDLSQYVPEMILKSAIENFNENNKKFKHFNGITTIRETPADELCWYPGPSPKDHYWPALKQYLLDVKGWSRSSIDSLDKSSSKLVSLLESPGAGVINIRGLVVGYVQSGKTANYSAVITKAADVGYKLFIVLSGLTDQLRNQTQNRLSQEITQLNLYNQKNWLSLTSPTEDFRSSFVGNATAFLNKDGQPRVLGVVKKNGAILRRLHAWLKSAHKDVLRNCPVLIIDDEADQASVNAARSKEDRTAINSLILQILSVFPKAAYIGYTATPFANVFIDPSSAKDLYPRDFIIDLPKPESYFGAERIFGREYLLLDDSNEQFEGLDMRRIIPDEEVLDLKPQGKNDRADFYPVITPSLAEALRYFWLATAARAARGDGDQHSTMLIHTTLYTEVHNRFLPIISKYRNALYATLKAENPDTLQQLRSQWEQEHARVPSEDLNLTPVSFDSLYPYLATIIHDTDIIIENSASEARLDYSDKGKVQIVIGGNILARGLTLEGLIVSYFLRTANAYDTLLQMGRWFGYRHGYEDLPRIWMTQELARNFRDMATVEQEIRNDIKRYELEGVTPRDFGLRIRTHPDLAITSRLKMGATVDCEVSFSGEFRQTILFKYTDAEWLGRNIQAARSLITNIKSQPLPSSRGSNLIFKDVPVELIFSFLQRYSFHERNRAFSSDLLTGYIQAENKHNRLLKWSVVVVTRKSQADEDASHFIDLGLSNPVRLLNRSRLIIESTNDTADLGVIVNGYTDIVADLDIPAEELKKLNSVALKKMRPEGSGLLLLYPIAKDSKPQRQEKKSKEGLRAPLDAVDHVIGVAFAFPNVNNGTPQKYKTVDLSGVEREEVEIIPEEDEEEE